MLDLERAFSPQLGGAESGPEQELEQEAAINRSSREYIQWVQRSLNTLAAARLTVDGISGPLTRAAVRDFQARQGLAVDGIVGPQTEGALLRAGASAPPGSSSYVPPAAQPLPPPSSGASKRASDGTPLFNQSDSRWAGRILGKNLTISSHGCAMTATAMALSKLTARDISPIELDSWLDAHGGYSGDAIRWDVAAAMVGLRAVRRYSSDWSLDALRAELGAGRPVVIGVNYKSPPKNPDHWITLTRVAAAASGGTWYASDPAGGLEIVLRSSGSALSGGSKNYRSTGDWVTFGR